MEGIELLKYDILLNELVSIATKVHYDVDTMCFIDDNNNDVLMWEEWREVWFDNPIPYKNDSIDGILFFGDGCLEFHLQDDGDALNWVEFEKEVIDMVIIELKKIIL
jgi:hypothetical protein